MLNAVDSTPSIQDKAHNQALWTIICNNVYSYSTEMEWVISFVTEEILGGHNYIDIEKEMNGEEILKGLANGPLGKAFEAEVMKLELSEDQQQAIAAHANKFKNIKTIVKFCLAEKWAQTIVDGKVRGTLKEPTSRLFKEIDSNIYSASIKRHGIDSSVGFQDLVFFIRCSDTFREMEKGVASNILWGDLI